MWPLDGRSKALVPRRVFPRGTSRGLEGEENISRNGLGALTTPRNKGKRKAELGEL